MKVKLYRMERQTVCVRMIFAIFRQALFPEFRCPGLEWQTIGKHGRKILERPWPGSGRRAESATWADGRAWRRTPVPDSGQIRPAIGGS